ncbi:hypothetical protein LRC537489_30350 [Mycobacterium riyadhense]
MLDHASFDMTARCGMVLRILPEGVPLVVHQIHDAMGTRGATIGITPGAKRIGLRLGKLGRRPLRQGHVLGAGNP